MQLVSGRVTLLDGMKDRRYGPAEVEERFGVPPERILDLRALCGDPSDDIPGVPGIGEKGAAALLAEWGDLESLLAHAGEVKAKRAREALLALPERLGMTRLLETLGPAPARAPEAGEPAPVRLVRDAAALRALATELAKEPWVALLFVGEEG